MLKETLSGFLIGSSLPYSIIFLYYRQIVDHELSLFTLNPSCVTRKKTARKETTTRILPYILLFDK